MFNILELIVRAITGRSVVWVLKKSAIHFGSILNHIGINFAARAERDFSTRMNGRQNKKQPFFLLSREQKSVVTE